jgi:chemotaxis receptor (MCP) glutamine deamidase CheD
MMQKAFERADRVTQEEIIVGENECRLARHGERLIARGVLADVVVTVQVPAGGFAAMLRFSAPQESDISGPPLEALWDFADQALDLLFQSIRSMEIPRDAVTVSAIGGADVAGMTFGRGKQLAQAIHRSFRRHGVKLSGNDLGGSQNRLIWLESASGRLIVRSQSPALSRCMQEEQGFKRTALGA